MIKPKKSRWFESFFFIYNRNLIRRRFNSLKVSGLNNLQDRVLSTPLIVYGNHSSWWDGLIAFHLSKTTNSDSFIMMEERHLKRFFLFRKLGAFSVVRENARKAVESMNFAVNLLRERPSRTLWIFPQGEILPNDARPINFYNGLARVVEKIETCSVVPIVYRYEFLKDFKPEIFVKIGERRLIETNRYFSAKNLTAELSLNLTALLDKLKADIANQQTDKYEKLI